MVSLQDIDQIFSISLPMVVWLSISSFNIRIYKMKQWYLFNCTLWMLITALLISLQYSLMLLMNYYYIGPFIGVEIIFFVDSIIGSFLVVGNITELLFYIYNFFNLPQMSLLFIITQQTIVFFCLILAITSFDKYQALLLLQILNLGSSVLQIIFSVQKIVVTKFKNPKYYYFFFNAKRRRSDTRKAYARLPQPTLNEENYSFCYKKDSNIDFTPENIYNNKNGLMFPHSSCSSNMIMFLYVAQFCTAILQLYIGKRLYGWLQDTESGIFKCLYYTRDSYQYIQQFVILQDHFKPNQFLNSYNIATISCLCITLLTIYEGSCKKPTISSVFTSSSLFSLFNYWLFENNYQFLLHFLYDTSLLKMQFNFDQTTANILFLKYYDLMMSNKLSITRYAMNILDKNLNSMNEDEDAGTIAYFDSGAVENSNNNTYRLEKDKRSKQRRLLNKIFYVTELEASIYLCILANIFLQKDNSHFYDIIYHFTSRYYNFIDILFGQTETYLVKNEGNYDQDTLRLYDSNFYYDNGILQYIDMYYPIINASSKIFPPNYDYTTDGNILDFLQDYDIIVQSKSQQYDFQHSQHIKPHALLQAKHSVVTRHIMAMQEIQLLLQYIQGSQLIPAELQYQLTQTLYEGIIIQKVEILESTNATNYSNVIKEADPTILFNEPQFVDFDVEINNINEIKEDLLDEYAKIDDQKSQKSKRSLISFSSSRFLAETYLYIKDKKISQQAKKTSDYMQVLFSDNYPEYVRMPLYFQEAEVNQTLYQFDMDGNCKLSLLQQTLYNVLVYIANVLHQAPATKPITKEYDVDMFCQYIQRFFFKTSFDAEQAELLSKGHCALTVTFLSLKYLQIDKLLKIPDTALFACIYELEQGYTPTYYHNRMHIADFVQMILLQILAVRTTYYNCYIYKNPYRAQSNLASSSQIVSTGTSQSIIYYQYNYAQSSNSSYSLPGLYSCSKGSSFQSFNQEIYILSPTDIFSMIMAACCHDYGHTGIDNPFCVTTQNAPALVYLDIGPMESSHASLSYGQILTRFNPIFRNFSLKYYREFRIKFVELVLATDMTFHFPFISKIQKIDSYYIIDYFTRFMNHKTNYRDQIFKWFIMKTIIKFGDLANPTRSFPVAEFWGFNYIQEYRVTGDLLKALQYTNIQKAQQRCEDFVENSQIGFVNFVLKPFIKEIQRLTYQAFYFNDGECLYDKLGQNMINTLEIWIERNNQKGK